MDDSDETGWKYIHGDVFRFPPHKNLFCAFVGSGAQVEDRCLPLVALSLCLTCMLCPMLCMVPIPEAPTWC